MEILINKVYKKYLKVNKVYIYRFIPKGFFIVPQIVSVIKRGTPIQLLGVNCKCNISS